ncbi:TRAP transporter large permease subunit [Castellaniella sp. GW247-6E4]|uniref:TRAP transporter large permease n=1 Tax=Castellaniella sp. GW247-6E4 TaxID=3140380 RepID=UPI0033145C95
MNETLIACMLIVMLFGLLFSGLWVAFSLIAITVVTLLFYSDWSTIGSIMATATWGTSAHWTLTALPLFIWMGEILYRTHLSDDLFHGLAPWVERLPGRLLHVNVLGCGVFAAVSGSSTATCATVGKIALPELSGRNYPRSIAVGSLAASGSLGILIPPSIIMIVYGGAADVSVAQLFIAGVLPGLLLMAMFSGYIGAYSLIRPGAIPKAERRTQTFTEMLKASRRMIPVVLLIGFVIGSIYAGLATPTEAAGIGVFGALILSAFYRVLTWDSFKQSLVGATMTSCMIAFIMAAAAMLSVAMGFAGIPRAVAEALTAMQLSPYLFLLGLAALLIILGCFLDGISIVLLTTAVLIPAVRAYGFDMVWFGVFLIIAIEISMITPPVGFNLFVVQDLTKMDPFSIAKASLPFFFVMLISIVLLTVYPEIATYLPSKVILR